MAEMKGKKSRKDNKKLDSFLEKRNAPISKETKSKPVKVQMTLEQMALIKKSQKKRRRSSDDFIVPDNLDV